MRMTSWYSCVVLSLLVGVTMAQGPFGFDFMGGMGGMMQNMESMMGNVMGNVRRMGQDAYAQQERYTRNLRPGEQRTFNHGNGRGFAYRSPDGSSSSYSFSSGGPGSHGYMYQSGPDGTWSRRW